jgi:GntR family transcriptional repressor for pyruvate dehydrogenase complex
MQIQRIDRTSVSENIKNQILEQISNGSIKPGSRLQSERELCVMFGVSRTSVREAIKGLLSLNVIIKENGVFYVSKDFSSLLMYPQQRLVAAKIYSSQALYEARMFFELSAVRIAAKKASNEEIEKMRQCINEIESTELTAAEHTDKFMEFHLMIAKATNNEIIEHMYNSITEAMYCQKEDLETITKESLKWHKKILQCIQNHDPDGAEKAMKSHLIQKKIELSLPFSENAPD